MTSVTPYFTEYVKVKNTLSCPIRTKRFKSAQVCLVLGYRTSPVFTLGYASGTEDVLCGLGELRIRELCSKHCAQEPSRKPSPHDAEMGTEVRRSPYPQQVVHELCDRTRD